MLGLLAHLARGLTPWPPRRPRHARSDAIENRLSGNLALGLRPAGEARTPLRISFLGFNPLGDGYDGRGKIDAGADRTFSSLDSLGARRLIRRHFGLGLPGRRCLREPLFDLRITGYSFGGWTAMQVVHSLAPWAGRFSVRVGLVDPVRTFRPTAAWNVDMAGWRWPLARRAVYGTRPAHVTWAENYYETAGLVARFGGDGFRLPYRATWFASGPIDGFENHDVTPTLAAAGAHIEIAETLAAAVARRTFGG